MSIELNNVSVSINEIQILENISFNIESYQFTCLVGPNGSGKSTILKSIVREIDNFDGEISDVKLRDICYLPQNLEDPAFLTVKEVGKLGFYVNDKKYGNVALLDDLIDTCGISSISDRKFTDISSGQKQRAWLVFALAQGKDVIIMDEPLSSVDQDSREKFYLLLRNIADMGKTLLMVTHDMDMAIKFSDRIIVLYDGRITYYGDTSEFPTLE